MCDSVAGRARIFLLLFCLFLFNRIAVAALASSNWSRRSNVAHPLRGHGRGLPRLGWWRGRGTQQNVPAEVRARACGSFSEGGRGARVRCRVGTSVNGVLQRVRSHMRSRDAAVARGCRSLLARDALPPSTVPGGAPCICTHPLLLHPRPSRAHLPPTPPHPIPPPAQTITERSVDDAGGGQGAGDALRCGAAAG